ncbi:hypothetical protein [Myroides odoratus]|uniref:Uncharacterized protein n=1 Tax=Myroides odoratus TaxID=256 RepID=A0A378RKQ5_MYROD|nr:hypothetical protein [Myroides odoratus]QQU02154.1 hypothetical protein I6I89_09740 [Myroides odoratus]STZ26939.1 Uncharacterised protein [Myroides odoratus]
MLPSKQINIYPKTDQNILAIIDFYFENQGSDRILALNRFKDTPLTINQIEFLTRKLSEAIIPIFESELSTITLDNLVQYGLDALLIGKNKAMSSNRDRITDKFRIFVENTESNINFT